MISNKAIILVSSVPLRVHVPNSIGPRVHIHRGYVKRRSIYPFGTWTLGVRDPAVLDAWFWCRRYLAMISWRNLALLQNMEYTIFP